MSPCPFWTKPMNLRWLVVPDDDSDVSSSAYPYATLLGGIRREVLRDRLSLPLHQFESQSLQWGACITRASRGEELHLYNVQVIKDVIHLRPSSLAFPPFRGNGSQDSPIQVPPLALHFNRCLIHPPTDPDGPLPAMKGVIQWRAVLRTHRLMVE
jgi:hypothetical protein